MEKSSRSQGSASSFEADSTDRHLESKMRTIRAIDSARVGTTTLALLMGLTVLAVSANTLRVYNETHVASDFLLPLWPDNFNVRPTVSLVVGSTIVLVSNIVALCFSQVGSLRARATAHTSITFLAPLLGLVGALIAVVFYYAANASDVADTFLSWTCRWRDVPMAQSPHWDTLCQQGHAGLYLAILLVPVEVVALGLGAAVVKVEGYTERYLGARKTPVIS
ncbi:hypothetical protein C8A05DRAFT_47310 [Staphylotrichum tortipilum]|uniref:Uncharacterized protein n=1 Tax=Staphylotrichum tortipilum TaxID=2831512 RepID=A0AAN6MDU1_9PEZI|nr:hypothetical protein C8A05DRAFT_47310 [Staphylotrichum longicolle]